MHRSYRVVKTVVWDVKAGTQYQRPVLRRQNKQNPDHEHYEVIPQSDTIDLSACQPMQVQIIGIGIVRRSGRDSSRSSLI